MTENQITEQFVAKFDAFATSLEPDEQGMLIELLTQSGADTIGGAAEVEGFGDGPMPYGGPYGHWGGPGWKWPGLTSLGIANVGGNELLAHEVTHVVGDATRGGAGL